MPRIHLCFLWHMHQPFYKDLVSGEYKLAWFDEEFQEHDPEIHEWIRCGRNFTPAELARMGEK